LRVVVTVTARVRRGAGMRLVFVSGGAPISTTTLDSDDQTIAVSVPMSVGGGYVRAEVRGQSRPNPTNPTASEGDMAALSNPVFLVVGALPTGYVARSTLIPALAGPRRAASRER
jgi:hypothetical protein